MLGEAEIERRSGYTFNPAGQIAIVVAWYRHARHPTVLLMHALIGPATVKGVVCVAFISIPMQSKRLFQGRLRLH